ncbi:MAG TPA: hypothetical protein VFV37_11750 [Luteibaculaceae bacterium]|nr:hypothetical protein [Luteibaculaceae bacterium]
MRNLLYISKLFIFIFLWASPTQIWAQKDIKGKPENLPFLHFSYALTQPAGTLKERFGLNSNIGGSVFYKTSKNFLFGAESSFMFSRQVKEKDLLKGISSDEGEIFDQDSRISQVILFQRGFTLTASVGKLFPIIGPNPNSGLLVKLGGGFMQHKIRVEHQNNRIPQLEGDYKKGYDRLTNGPMLSQFLGYMHMSNNKLINFMVGFECVQGFTQSRRSFNFDTRQADTRKRLDILYGVRLGWSISLYKRTSNNFYYD